jgi:hypothetical protein
MWIALWVLVTAFLIGVTGWSFLILVRQKKAWEIYAKKKNLIFKKGTLMGPPEISGVIGAMTIGLFTSERPTNDVRGKRYVTTVEVTSPKGVFDGVVSGTKEMLPFMQSLTKIHPYEPKHKDGWDESHYIFVTEDPAADAYFSKTRLDVLSTFLKTKNVDAVAAITAKQIVLRVETFDPMQDADKIEKAIDRMIVIIDKLSASDTEIGTLMAMTSPQST